MKSMAQSAVFIFVSLLFVATTASAAINCDLTTLQTAVNNATPGSTIICNPGAWTWNSKLSITKGVILKAQTKGGTTITSNTGDEYLIEYNPTNYDLNTPFRISGFVFDINPNNLTSQNGGAIDLGNVKTPPYTIQTNIRIDNNIFKNQTHGFTNTGLSQQAIYDNGVMRGVVDNNSFLNYSYPLRSPNAASAGALWNSTLSQFNSIHYGLNDDSMYYEDNIFTKPDADTGQRPVSDCQYSGRYTFRYNTITVTGQQYPLFDMHGNATAGGSDYSCFGGELYGNRVIAGSAEVRFLDQRGGKTLVFGNSIETTGSAAINVRAEFPERSSAVTVPPQHVSNSYYWSNRKNSNGAFFSVGEGTGNENDLITADTDYFYQQNSFNGMSGVGVGTQTSRPTSCKPGVGYWQTTQNLSSLTGMVGANPANPLQGSLYKCNAAGNGWDLFYTPLAYPHPIRANCVKYPALCDSGAPSTTPDSPNSLRVW